VAVVRGDQWQTLHGEERLEHLRAALRSIVEDDANDASDDYRRLQERAAEALRVDDVERRAG